MTERTMEVRKEISCFDDYIEPFLEHLRAAGYAERTLIKKRTVARAFVRWSKQQLSTSFELNDGHFRAFLGRSPKKNIDSHRYEVGFIGLLLPYLRSIAVLQPQPPENSVSPAENLLNNYKTYLCKDCGLTKNTLQVYGPFIRIFLAAQSAKNGLIAPESFDELKIRSFIVEHTIGRSSEYTRLLCTALRSFFHFLFVTSRTQRDLYHSVPAVRKYLHATPPSFLSTEEVEQVLTATDRSTATGQRDYAILLLLARLGLRAGEIALLELGDVRWRAGELVVRGKGQVVDHMPLLSDVGEALVVYLREGRGVSASRRIFLRVWAPHTGLTGPAAIGHIVRRALVQADVRRSGRGAAHLFRHGLATKMIRHGASITEIAEVLRHRSQTTTAIYAHVSTEALRGVSQPWPAKGGTQ
jgi:integrase/recombinase XerD